MIFESGETEGEKGTKEKKKKRKKRQKQCPLDRNRAGDLSVSINAFTAERDSQLHHKGIDLWMGVRIRTWSFIPRTPLPCDSRHPLPATTKLSPSNVMNMGGKQTPPVDSRK
jgi:hypothetical protein